MCGRGLRAVVFKISIERNGAAHCLGRSNPVRVAWTEVSEAVIWSMQRQSFIQAASVEGHGCPCGAQVLYLLIGVRKATANFEAVRVLAHELPDLQESTMYGSPALKLGKRLVACVAIHRSAEPGSLVVRTDFEQRAALLADDPGTFYVTDHYVSHPVVLVRMSRLQQDQLRELLDAARQCVPHPCRSEESSAPRAGRV